MSTAQSINSLALLAKLVKFFAWSFIGLALFQIAAVGYETFKPPVDIVVSAGPLSEPAIPIWPLIFGMMAILMLVSVFGLMLFALLWIHRAHSNLIEQRVEMAYSPGWAVGSYFVPFINLIVPMRAMRELHNRSHGEVAELAHAPVDDVGAWWTAYIIGIFVTTALVFKVTFDALTNIVFLTPVWMEFAMSSFSSLLLVIAAAMLAKLVGAITTAQSESSHVSAAFE